MAFSSALLNFTTTFVNNSEAVTRRCSLKKVFWEILQISQENTCARVSFIKKETLGQVFSCEFCQTSKNTFSYRTPPLGASDIFFILLCATIHILI